MSDAHAVSHRASGEEVLPEIFVETDGSCKELAHAAADRLAVVPSRCVLLSPAGDRMAHTQTLSDATLVDGDVITVLVFAEPRVFAHRVVSLSPPSKEMVRS